MPEKEYTLNVYNPATKQAIEIVVSKAVYDEYRRGDWRIQKNEAKHTAHEIAFSELTGNPENFHEFWISKAHPLELQLAMETLSSDEEEIIHAVFDEGIKMREYAYAKGIAVMTAQDRKTRALRKLKKLLDFQK